MFHAFPTMVKPLIFALIGSFAAGQSPTTVRVEPVPPLLRKALDGLPGLSLLNPSRDLVGGYTLQEIKDFGYWPPWIVRDLDRDGRSDIAAVVVKPGANPEFGVIAVHARNASQVVWIVDLNTQELNGVAKGWGRDTIVPLHCIECDSNGWLRWSGRSYEWGLYAVGDRVGVATYDTDHALGFFAGPTRDSQFLFQVEPCTEAVVRRVGGSEKDRWYFVETRKRRLTRGWIPASFADTSECIA